MFQLSKDKRGISNIISYVLLISISIALSIMVYDFLRDLTQDTNVEKCPEGVSLIVQSYICSHGLAGNETSRLNVTLKNKGRFDIDGFILNVNDREGAGIGIFTLDEVGAVIPAGKSANFEYNISNKNITDGEYMPSFNDALKELTYIEVQAYRNNGGDELACSVLSSQVIDSCP